MVHQWACGCAQGTLMFSLPFVTSWNDWKSIGTDEVELIPKLPDGSSVSYLDGEPVGAS